MTELDRVLPASHFRERHASRFRLYWLAIRPFSGLIRRVWLRAIKRRAESA